MHNCKVTKQRLLEQALAKKPDDRREIERVDFEGCPVCLEVFAAVSSLLRVTDQALESVQPAESFWNGYHDRLRQSIERNAALPSPSVRPEALVWLKNLFTAHVRIPVPIAAVLMVLFGLSVVFAVQARRSSNASNSSGERVITRTVEVPVFQERIVTRTVYRDNPSARQNRTQLNQSFAKTNKRRQPAIENAPASLAGFKPANEARVTIIKGNER